MHRYASDELLKLAGMSHDAAAPKQRRANDSKHHKIYPKLRYEAIALSDTLVTKSDGTQYVMAKSKTKSKSKTVKSKTHAQLLHERMMQLPTIHDTVN